MPINIRSTAALLICLLATGVSVPGAAQDLIPQPQRLERRDGSFRLDRNVRIVAPDDVRSREVADFLRSTIGGDTGLALAEGRKGKAIELRLDPEIAGEEAYRVAVGKDRIVLAASNHRGLLWAVQTLRQLFPLKQGQASIPVPAVYIEDAPQFSYRGHMLDVARHFMPVEFVKKQIDLLSYYKLNTFHWHLTDDQGWRIEIKKYPKLTEVGAWRTEADGSRYGGFYTQDQIRDIVEYARLRNITVIPEIEMPGHASAALASYPELSCRKQPIDVPNAWGVIEDVYCVGDEFTFEFIENVLDEVIALFPAPYVHIGGDEVPKDRWRESASSQKRLRDESLKDEHELQSYFVKRIQRYLAGKGRTLIGWDEILEGGADRNAIVEVWRGDAEGIKALANGNKIVSAGPFYLDSPLSALTLEKVYATEIVPAAYAAYREQVLGAEAPLWTEWVTTANAETLLYPRLIAFADVTWGAATRDYPDFLRRLRSHYRRLEKWQVGFGPEDRNVVDFHVAWDSAEQAPRVDADRGFADLRLRYTTDGSDPVPSSPEFADSLTLRQAGRFRITPFRGDRAYASPRDLLVLEHKGAGKPIQYSSQPQQNYRQAGEQVLADGMLGGDSHADGLWTGWQGEVLRASIDLQKPTPVNAISARFLQQSNAWILLPKAVRYSVSSDGKQWTQVYARSFDAAADDDQRQVEDAAFHAKEPLTARYVRMEVEGYGNLPAGHKGAGHPAYFFVDEIVVE
ncbi:family 20 glycosylhydrolase [Pseudoxanthomonas sacheonensis]|uniref:family 20 glycosylhydrolase n=1 Tax=Pseudoxanthomonas sacheonensis TaxID=443615 RepID=UPI0013D26B35|nr:family 20 glycosylhydrolase [Pseudoxanthomonas sacheonensis]